MTTKLPETITHEVMEPRISGEFISYDEKQVTSNTYRCDGCGNLWAKRWYADSCGERNHRNSFDQKYYHKAEGYTRTGEVKEVIYTRYRIGRDSRVPTEDVVMEASLLGLAPGQWPASFEHDGVTYHAACRRVRDGELEAVIYRSAPDSRAKLIVLND